MIEKKKIIGVGSPIVDSIAHVEEAFVEAIDGAKGGMELVEADAIAQLLARITEPPTESPGGSAGNTLFALARMGVDSGFLGKIGTDAIGTFYRERFEQLGGDASRFKLADVPNGRCLSLVTPDGERTMRTDLGAAMTLTPDEISAADFAGFDHAHIEGYLLFNRDLMFKVLESAREAGCSISLDLASFEVVQATKDILPNLLRDYVSIVFANEEEGEAFTGMDDDHAAMARELANLCEIAVVKIGARGSWVCSGDRIAKVESVPVKNVVDTTGAGDAFHGAFALGLARGLPLRRLMRYASAVGALTCMRPGARSALPDSKRVEALDPHSRFES